jgi:hypothetical protein
MVYNNSDNTCQGKRRRRIVGKGVEAADKVDDLMGAPEYSTAVLSLQEEKILEVRKDVLCHCLV